MYKCTMDKGLMTFRSDNVSYTPSGKSLTSMGEVADEYNLVQEIIRDHAWAFPVVERLNERSSALLRNLMELYNGRNIQHTENDASSGSSGRRGSAGSVG
ncbi:MAG: hypothetical protein JXA96_17315 [Sedimentisphaerales bacterium]|nr:hypothetical protein [Sedimentisphaerales bacterium]